MRKGKVTGLAVGAAALAVGVIAAAAPAGSAATKAAPAEHADDRHQARRDPPGGRHVDAVAGELRGVRLLPLPHARAG